MYSKIKPYLPSDHLIGKVSLFLSVMAMFFAVSSGSGNCLYAEECSVGDSESFSNNIRLYSNSTNYHEITGDATNPNTSDHTLLLPNKNGTLLSTAMNFGNDQYLKTNAQGDIISDDLPPLDLDNDAEFDLSGITSGKFLQTTGTGLNFVDVDINETTFDSSSGSEGQILQISGGSLTFQNMSGGGSVSLTAKGSITGGRVVASVVDSNELKVEPITSLQASANTSVYPQASITSSANNRYFHYNEVDDRYLECNYLSGYFQCRTGTINSSTNEITWNSFATISSTFSWASAITLQKSCAYADNPSHNYYLCVVQTSQGNDNYSRILTFSIDSTGNSIDTGEMDFKICQGNYGYTYGRCRTGVPVFDTQSDTWIIAHAIDGPTSSTGFSGQYGVVVSKDIVMNSNETCNGVPCGFPSNYAYSLKVSYPSGSPNAFDQNRWQPVADCYCVDVDSIQFAYLNDGDSNIYEYMLAVYPNGSQGNFDNGGWSTIYMERTSGTGAYTLGTPDYNVNDLSLIHI